MKKLISTIIVIVMLLMSYGNLGVFADDTMLSAYADILNGHRENGMTPRYLIYDIDGNDIPELIIMNGTCEADKTVYFYTFFDGKALALGELGAWHAWYKTTPNKDGLVMFNGRETVGELISIVGGTLYIEEGYEYTDNMLDIGFYDKNDMSGFGDFNYVAPDKVSTTLYDTGTKKGIDYYNKGLYYEAINEIQWFCDANWYNMTAEQQQNALYYLNNAKTKLADYQFTTGKNYYNKGLYYEAKPYFESAIDYYEQLNYGTQWQSANDYLYNTNEKIKAWENRTVYLTNGSGNYSYYGGTNIPTYTSAMGRNLSHSQVVKGVTHYVYLYPKNFDDNSIVNESTRYMTILRSLGWEEISNEESEYGITFYFMKGNTMVGVTVDFNIYDVMVSILSY